MAEPVRLDAVFALAQTAAEADALRERLERTRRALNICAGVLETLAPVMPEGSLGWRMAVAAAGKARRLLNEGSDGG